MLFRKQTSKQKSGETAENLAQQYLKKQGLKLLDQNFRYYSGEIDLIMQDKNAIVFVEVRYRQSNRYGNAAESVTYSKQQKIIHTAQFYLKAKKYYEKFPYRFDIVAIENSLITPNINWIKNAF